MLSCAPGGISMLLHIYTYESENDIVHCVAQIFVYPNNVAYPFGGDGQAQYVVMELHYDNPQMISGTYLY